MRDIKIPQMSKTSLRIPYFKVHIGSREGYRVTADVPTAGVGGIMSAATEIANKATAIVKQGKINTTEKITKFLEKYITKVEVSETMDGPEQFTIEIKDPEMNWMFNEQLFLGRQIMVDMGYWQGGELKWRPKAEGFMNQMEYTFPEDGVPRLILRGFGMIWDVLNKTQESFDITITSVLPDGEEWVEGPARAKGYYPSIVKFLQQVGLRFGLVAIPGLTMPKNLDAQVLRVAGTINVGGRVILPQVPFTKPPASLDLSAGGIEIPKPYRVQSSGQNTWNGFLRSMADELGCVFLPKGRYIRFYPAAWINAAVMQGDTIRETISEYEKQLPNETLPDIREALKKQIATLKEEEKKQNILASQGYTDGEEDLKELHYRYGMKNLLSFAPKLTDLNTSGYMAMALDPDTGAISFATSAEPSEAGTYSTTQMNFNKTDKEKITEQAGIKLENPKTVSKATSDELAKANIGPELTAEEQNYQKLRLNQITGIGPKNEVELQGMTDATFRKWMWFTEASATAIGEIDYTVGIPVMVRGLGYQTDNGKVCGRWFVFKVTHRIQAGKDYICEFQLKRYWQFPQEMDRGEAATNDYQTPQSIGTELGTAPRRVIQDVTKLPG